MITNEIDTTQKLPYPSHVTTPAPNLDVHPFAADLVNTSQELNNTFAASGNVHKFVRCHFVDVATGTYGIESLIASILKANGATFAKGVESTPFRSTAIAKAMFVSEIIDSVRSVFGADRYPDNVIATYLAHHMQKEKSANKVGKIQLSGLEDKNRTSPKPRAKYYLIEIPLIPA